MRVRTVVSVVLTGLALALLHVALVLPDRLDALEPVAFLRLPLEGLVAAAVLLVLPRRLRLVTAVGAGLVLAVLVLLKVLDLGFLEALNRPFDPVIDWRYAGSLVALVRDSTGPVLGPVLLGLAGLAILALLVLLPLAVVRLAGLLHRDRRRSGRVLVALAAAWLLLLATGVRDAGGGVATAGASAYAWGQVARVPSVLADQRHFQQATRSDPLRSTPAGDLLQGLRGYDVLLVFVESYGRVAVQGTSYSAGVDRVLAQGQRDLAADGFTARSAFLTSPTFGALSWLAHSTLQSGLWVDSQQRYDVLVTSRRATLSQAFGRAGWRTVSTVPANTKDWPQGAFYDYDHLYDSRNVGYRGPRFGYPTMPDQYTLDALQRLELAPRSRRPVFAEVDLVSSHAPWSRTPRMIDQATVGDGSVYAGMPATLPSEADIWPDAGRVRAAYGHAVEYSLQALFSFVEHYGTDRTVLVVLGDHQPATIVSGEDSGRDVPVSVIARDPAVLDRIDSWRWPAGLRPPPDAPVWRMDAFRDRFLAAYAR